jgi:NAD-dependent dihydropyrimidine dehydrogenase PreA subunit
MRTLCYLKNNTLLLNEDKCIGCGKCIEVCPHGVFSLANKKARIAHKRYCMECGACQKNCPVEAISVNSGVGCATAVITGILKGTEPVCGCSADGSKNSSGCC